jgi:hypothetical protein
MAQADKAPQHDVVDQIAGGGDSPFSGHNLLKTAFTGSYTDNGGGMGDKFNATKAQASIDHAMANDNPYQSMFT